MTAPIPEPATCELDSHSRLRPLVRITLLSLAGVIAVGGIAAAVENYLLNHIARTGTERQLVVRLDAPYGSVDVRPGAAPNDVATVELLNEDADAHNFQWSYGVNNALIGMLRIGLGTDEGMRSQPPIAMWDAHSGFSPAVANAPQPDWGSACPSAFYSFTLPSIPSGYGWTSHFRVVTTDAGTFVTPEARAGTRISLTKDLPMSLAANLGFGESTLDLSGLSITDASIETGASKAHIYSVTSNPVRMRACSVRAGIGQCTFNGISNLNADHFTFHGAVGSYHLGFEGTLVHNLDANIELGMGICTLSIPATAGRVQIFYEDGLLSSFSFSGLAERRDGYYTSVGFDRSNSPVLTLHLSTSVGKISVSYH